ncbi:RNA polymerase sigma factor [Salisediminibacterium selenitireducens]|uniref:RNA polymerase, sigma-24 subunit, ECF subfamily n=1 Tax=Bacillus selenitireducens (strain ATCC 700615 / DSM 15326 / MLS10) TaxID=439292 RepID=D6XV87_BACIE|nr:RNA polymerase sigma factor [Salisediminibacterium selenitireducens]ADH97645.1 RNA polymerase, sigma-24 subunit, ECF subfamily [[Bacillus] selenitireducens MLS10]
MDEELVKDALKGDERAFETLHARHADDVFRYVYMKVGNRQDAEELLQDVFVKMVRNLAGFSGKSTFRTWLFSIVRHTVIDYYRKKGRLQKEQPVENDLLEAVSDTTASAEEVASNREKRSHVSDAFNSLPEGHREILYLRFMEGFSLKETARITGKSVMAVKSLQKRAQAKMGEQVDEEVNIHV